MSTVFWWFLKKIFSAWNACILRVSRPRLQTTNYIALPLIVRYTAFIALVFIIALYWCIAIWFIDMSGYCFGLAFLPLRGSCPALTDCKLYLYPATAWACPGLQVLAVKCFCFTVSLRFGLCYLIRQIRCDDSLGKMIWCATQVKPANTSHLLNACQVFYLDSFSRLALPGHVPGAVLAYTASYQNFHILGKLRYGLRFYVFLLLLVTFKACLHGSNVV